MRLDRYIGEEPKFKVQRRQPDGTYKDVPPFDYFVLALKDEFARYALSAYGEAAHYAGDAELADDIARLHHEAISRSDSKRPD